jgi:hypothetical protein
LFVIAFQKPIKQIGDKGKCLAISIEIEFETNDKHYLKRSKFPVISDVLSFV